MTSIMTNYRYFFLFCASLLAIPSAHAHGRKPPPTPTPTPPPSTGNVYAVASDGTKLTWEVFTPSGKGPWPAVLVIHGGMFISGTSDDAGAANCARGLAAAGYIAFSINYRLAPPGVIPGQKSSGRYPDQYDDVQLAVLAARSDSRCSGKVGAVGGSAGGTHMAWVATHGKLGADRIDVGVGLSGAYDFSDERPDANLGIFLSTVTNYVGVPATDIGTLQEASPAWQVDRTTVPLFLVDSQGDIMPAAQLDDLVAHLQSAGVPTYQAMTVTGSGHSFVNWPLVSKDAIAFLAATFGKSR